MCGVVLCFDLLHMFGQLWQVALTGYTWASERQMTNDRRDFRQRVVNTANRLLDAVNDLETHGNGMGTYSRSAWNPESSSLHRGRILPRRSSAMLHPTSSAI